MQLFISFQRQDEVFVFSLRAKLQELNDQQEQRVSDEVYFEVATPLGFRVRIGRSYWEVIVSTKHPVMRGREAEVQQTLQDPDHIRRSRYDPAVHLFYRLVRPDRWICAVAKRLNGEGFLITTYPTDAIKEGEQIWSK